MTSVKIPKWLGPVLTPIVLILLVVLICFYYCYWKPRRERKKEAKEKKQSENKKMISPTTSRYSPGSIRHNKKSTSYMDEELSYGYYDCDTYGPYFMDYCPIPNGGMSYCVNSRPKFVYCPNTFPQAKSRVTAESRCKSTEGMRHCKVKCPRGECIKCPELPMITEAESTVSLCEVKEENEQKDLCNGEGIDIGYVCSDDGGQTNAEGDTTQEVESNGVGNDTINCCRDSGYEDQEL